MGGKYPPFFLFFKKKMCSEGENDFSVLMFVSILQGGETEALKRHYCVDLQRWPGLLRDSSICHSSQKVCPSVEVPVLIWLVWTASQVEKEAKFCLNKECLLGLLGFYTSPVREECACLHSAWNTLNGLSSMPITRLSTQECLLL